MKYLTKKESKKTFFEGKEVELVNYVPETPIEALYFLQPPPEPTFEGQIKQLIIKMFLQIEAGQNKRLQYHFSPHEFMKIHGVDENMKTEMLRKLRETLSYFPEDKVNKHLEAIREYIETFTPLGLPPQPIVKQKSEQETPKIFDELFYNTDLVDPCIDILKELDPPLIDTDCNFIGKLKGVFCVWIDEMQRQGIVKHYSDRKIFASLIPQKIKRFSIDESMFGKYQSKAEILYRTDIKTKVSKIKFSQDSQ